MCQITIPDAAHAPRHVLLALSAFCLAVAEGQAAGLAPHAAPMPPALEPAARVAAILDEAPALPQPPAVALSTAGAEALPTAPAASTVTTSAAMSSVPVPPVPSPESVAATAAPQTGSPAFDVNERDAAGLPWDSRIHSSTHGKVTDGTWKRRRGVVDQLVTKVEAELRAVAAIPVVPLPAAPAPVSEAVAAFGGAAVPAPPVTFASLLQRITAAVTAGTIAQDAALQVVQAQGVPTFPLLATRPDLVGSVSDAFRLLGV